MYCSRTAEHHPSGAGLQNARHGEVDLLADMLAAPFDDDHGAVFQVADALARLFAGLDHADLDLLAGQEDRLQGVGQSLRLMTSTPSMLATLLRL